MFKSLLKNLFSSEEVIVKESSSISREKVEALINLKKMIDTLIEKTKTGKRVEVSYTWNRKVVSQYNGSRVVKVKQVGPSKTIITIQDWSNEGDLC